MSYNYPNTYISPLPPKPCPTCGRCPTCGHSHGPAPIYSGTTTVAGIGASNTTEAKVPFTYT